ncbi:hypothetical protein ACVR05_09850 [Streptococcus caprae]|uniref:Uncharacterized protein n=1 Tax=Streptococcus caprae TaxID=1640501 RepID=A0ABV8CTJ8_9STRE
MKIGNSSSPIASLLNFGLRLTGPLLRLFASEYVSLASHSAEV